jgi:transposase
MRKIREVLRLKFEAQLADREIARAVPTSRGTVQNYLERAQAAGVSWPLPEGMDEEKLEAWLFPKGEARPSHPQPDFDAIRDELLRHKGMTRMLAWEEHKRANPQGMQYSAFCDRYRAWAKTQDLVLRQPHDPGAAMYVDYAGETAEITNPETGETTRVKLFVAVLGHSNLTYAEATRGETTSDWLSGQARALDYFGGVPKKIVPDNPKALVTRASRYDPDLNPSYQEFALHYSVAIVPARVRSPRDKAKVETAVQVAERWVLARLRNQVFFSLSDLNGAIKVLVEEMNEKPFQKLPGSRRSRFEENERSALSPLPDRPYAFSTWRKAKVHVDYHVEVETHYYSVPHIHAGRTVDVRLAERSVEVFHRGSLVAAHARSWAKGGYTTVVEHRPERHREYLDLSHEKLLARAEAIGPRTATVLAAQIHQHNHPDLVLRNCQGILRFAKDYGPEALEDAAGRAVEVNAMSYRALHGFLRAPRPKPPVPPPSIEHENIRGAEYFQEAAC